MPRHRISRKDIADKVHVQAYRVKTLFDVPAIKLTLDGSTQEAINKLLSDAVRVTEGNSAPWMTQMSNKLEEYTHLLTSKQTIIQTPATDLEPVKGDTPRGLEKVLTYTLSKGPGDTPCVLPRF